MLRTGKTPPFPRPRGPRDEKRKSMHLGLQALDDQRRHEPFDGAAELGHFAHDARAEIAVFFRGHHEDGFDVGLETAVHERHLEFVFVVGDGADAAEDDLGVAAADIVDEQAVEEIDFDVGPFAGDLAEHFRALGSGEERGFVEVLEDGDDEAFEDACAASDEVQMPVGNRVKGARVDGDDVPHAR